ncbi:hypothetical protein SAMN05192541_10118 [Bradyrhizobium arachidis]|nr:hypothetical protein SAMN05192541_10118 [Bradyrhizobium arachidis]
MSWIVAIVGLLVLLVLICVMILSRDNVLTRRWVGTGALVALTGVRE